MDYGIFKEFVQSDYWDYDGEKFSDGSGPFIYRNNDETIISVVDPNCTYLELWRPEIEGSDYADDFTRLEFVLEIPKDTGVSKRRRLTDAENIIKSIENKPFKEQYRSVKNKFGIPVYVESPLFDEEQNLFEKDINKAESILFAKFKAVSQNNKEDFIYTNDKEELLDWVYNQFEQDLTDEVSVKNMETDKVKFFTKEDFE